MPESDVNKNLGMFMNCVQLYSGERKKVKSNCRSAMLRYRSESVRSLERYFIWPFLLTGHTDEKQYVHIPLLDDLLDDPLHPAIRLDFQVTFFGTYLSQITQPLFFLVGHVALCRSLFSKLQD